MTTDINTLTHAQTISAPIAIGDAGVVIKPDGSFQIFNAGKTYDPAAMSDEDLLTGAKLVTIAYVLQNEDVLNEMINRAMAAGCFQPMPKPKLNA